MAICSDIELKFSKQIESMQIGKQEYQELTNYVSVYIIPPFIEQFKYL